MTTLEIVVIAVVVAFGLLALGGALLNRRRKEASSPQFDAALERVNHDLAAAHAADNGWEPTRVTESARRAFAEQRPDVSVQALELVQVIDPPGTDEDKAIFRVQSADGVHRLTLGRHGDHWHFDRLD